MLSLLLFLLLLFPVNGLRAHLELLVCRPAGGRAQNGAALRVFQMRARKQRQRQRQTQMQMQMSWQCEQTSARSPQSGGWKSSLVATKRVDLIVCGQQAPATMGARNLKAATRAGQSIGRPGSGLGAAHALRAPGAELEPRLAAPTPPRGRARDLGPEEPEMGERVEFVVSVSVPDSVPVSVPVPVPVSASASA